MKKKLLIVIVLLLIAPMLLVQIPNVVASNTTDNFSYHPTYWEDWIESTSNCGGLRWETNHTVLVGTNDSTVYGSSSFTKMSRYFEIDDDEERFDLESEFHIFNTTVTWNGLFGFYLYYKDGDAFSARWLGNSLRIYYRNRAGSTSYEYIHSYFSPYDGIGYWKIDIQLEDYIWTITIYNDSSSVTRTYETNLAVQQLDYLMIQAYRGGGYPDISGYVWWVDAPFQEVRGLREWDETNTHEYVWENPYNMTVDNDGESANATVLCMPLQGFKTLWNWDFQGTTAYGRIDIRFRSRDSTEYGFIRWESQWGGGNHYFRFIDSSGTYFTLTNHFTQTDAVSLSFWIEKSGSVFMYAQDDPESHTFCDFWIIEVTDEVDLDSWGGRIDVYVSKVGVGGENRVALKETEIFYGMKEGISQPRFGGMWWESNPIIMFFIFLINAILAPFVWLGNLITTFLAPLFAGIGVWIAQVVTDFINNFIAPMVTGFFDWFIANFIGAIVSAVLFVITVVNTLLGGLSGLMFAGDTTILPNAFWGFINFVGNIFLLIATNIASVGEIFYIFSGLAFGSPVVGVVLGAGMNFITVIFYYVATYAPIAFMFYILMTLMQCVRQQDIMPLINMSLMLFSIGMFIFNIFKSVLTFIFQAMVSLLELIPL